jgi:ABC-type branched-subunit amino acid transport system substrate-binding protein
MQVASPQANVLPVSGPQRPRGGRAILIGALLAGMVGCASWLLWFGKPEAARVGAEAGVSDGEVLVGMSSALDGPSKALGQGMHTGVGAWLREVNDRGGVHGRKVRLVALDDGYEPDRCLANMRELVETRKVFAILGNVGTPTAQVAVPYAVRSKKIFFGAYTGAGLLRQTPPDRYVFNFRASYAEETAAMVKHLVERQKLAPDRIAVFAQKDSYGDAGHAGVVKQVQTYGVSPEKILRVGYERNTVVVEPAVQEILRHKDRVKAIIMVPTYKPAAKFIKLLRDEQVDVTFGIVSFVNSEALADEFRKIGLRYADGVIVSQVVPYFKYLAAGGNEYEACMQKHFSGQPLSFISLEGFLAAQVFVEGLERSGRNLTTETMVEALESIRELDLGIGIRLAFGPAEHQACHQVWVTKLDGNGNYRPLVID